MNVSAADAAFKMLPKALQAIHMSCAANIFFRAMIYGLMFVTFLCQALVREQFVSMYSGPNVLTEFLWDVNCVGEAPMRGTFNLNDVVESEFMFS